MFCSNMNLKTTFAIFILPLLCSAFEATDDTDARDEDVAGNATDPYVDCKDIEKSWCLGAKGFDNSVLDPEKGCLKDGDCELLLEAHLLSPEKIQWSFYSRMRKLEELSAFFFISSSWYNLSKYPPENRSAPEKQVACDFRKDKRNAGESGVYIRIGGKRKEAAFSGSYDIAGGPQEVIINQNPHLLAKFESKTWLSFTRKKSNDILYVADLVESKLYPHIVKVTLNVGSHNQVTTFGSTPEQVPILVYRERGQTTRVSTSPEQSTTSILRAPGEKPDTVLWFGAVICGLLVVMVVIALVVVAALLVKKKQNKSKKTGGKQKDEKRNSEGGSKALFQETKSIITVNSN